MIQLDMDCFKQMVNVSQQTRCMLDLEQLTVHVLMTGDSSIIKLSIILGDKELY